MQNTFEGKKIDDNYLLLFKRGYQDKSSRIEKGIIIFPLICIRVFPEKANIHKYVLKIIGEILEQSIKKDQSPTCWLFNAAYI